jgi:hypothetical protein
MMPSRLSTRRDNQKDHQAGEGSRSSAYCWGLPTSDEIPLSSAGFAMPCLLRLNILNEAAAGVESERTEHVPIRQPGQSIADPHAVIEQSRLCLDETVLPISCFVVLLVRAQTSRIWSITR